MVVYDYYTRGTLRGMLECRGGTPGSKRKKTLIKELQALDQVGAASVKPPVPTPVLAEEADDTFCQRARQRIALLGPDPSEADICQVLRDVGWEIEQEKERQHELRLATFRGTEIEYFTPEPNPVEPWDEVYSSTGASPWYSTPPSDTSCGTYSSTGACTGESAHPSDPRWETYSSPGVASEDATSPFEDMESEFLRRLQESLDQYYGSMVEPTEREWRDAVRPELGDEVLPPERDCEIWEPEMVPWVHIGTTVEEPARSEEAQQVPSDQDGPCEGPEGPREELVLPNPPEDTVAVSAGPAEELATGQCAAGLCPFPVCSEEQQDFPVLAIPQPLFPDPLDASVASHPPAEELATGQSAAGLCPPPICPEEQQDFSVLATPQPLFPDPLDVSAASHPPAEELAAGQSAAGLCPLPICPEEQQGSSELVTLQPLSSPDPLKVSFATDTPAEELAAGQSAAGLCPLCDRLEEQTDGFPGRDCPQPLIILGVEEPVLPQGGPHPAAELATGQSAAGLCPPVPSCLGEQEGDTLGLFFPQPLTPADSLNVAPTPTPSAGELPTGQRAAGLCPLSAVYPEEQPGPLQLFCSQPLIALGMEGALFPQEDPHSADALATGEGLPPLWLSPHLFGPEAPHSYCSPQWQTKALGVRAVGTRLSRVWDMPGGGTGGNPPWPPDPFARGGNPKVAWPPPTGHGRKAKRGSLVIRPPQTDYGPGSTDFPGTTRWGPTGCVELWEGGGV